MRARMVLRLATAALAGLTAASVAQTDADRGQTAGQSVGQRYGSRESVESRIFQPLQSDRTMQTLDGREFDARLECPAQQEFMRVSFAPSAHHDLQVVSVELDRDLDGTLEDATVFPGPFSAVCSNGAVVCAPGTTSDCRGRRWRSSGASLVADDVATDQLGGCYCFNDSCGAGLLSRNSSQVLGDLGSGIAAALQNEYPRLAMGSARPVDATTMQFYGQASGCGTDTRPEQYFQAPEQIRTAGEVAAATPGTLHASLISSDVAHQAGRTTQHCDLVRTIGLRHTVPDPDSILSFQGGQNVATTSCGERCIDITLGRPGNDYLSANCGSHSDVASWTLHRPEMIESAVLTVVSFDDYVSTVFDDTQIVYSEPAGWDGRSPRCGENQNRGTRTPHVDVTGYLRAKVPGATWTWRNTIWLTDEGDGYSTLRLRFHEDCEIDREAVDDACDALESNLQCTRRDETIDGVVVYRDYYATGLAPLPSSQTLTQDACRLQVTRNWWRKQRTYVCEGEARAVDASFASERYGVISASFDPNTGHFDDVRTQIDGSQSQVSLITSLPPPQDAGCQPMCKTRKPRAGQAMGQSGSTGTLNPSTPAWDTTYRDCTTGDVCPLGEGEDLVSACDCSNTFLEAVSVMQTIRMTAQDMQCNPP